MTEPLPSFLNEVFDRGIDPIADPRVQAWLDAHPGSLEKFVGLWADLEGLAELSTRQSGRFSSPRRRVLLAVGAAVALVAVLLPIAVWDFGVAPSPLPRPNMDLDAVRQQSLVTDIRGVRSSLRRELRVGEFTRRCQVTYRRIQEPSALVPHCSVVVIAEEILMQ